MLAISPRERNRFWSKSVLRSQFPRLRSLLKLHAEVSSRAGSSWTRRSDDLLEQGVELALLLGGEAAEALVERVREQRQTFLGGFAPG
jgi:hypothetical protein